MSNTINSPDVHRPTTLAELSSVMLSHKESLLWAGGTNIMTKKNSYPNSFAGKGIIYLGDVAEMKRFQRNDRFTEFGANVPLYEILSTGKTVLPKLLVNNLQNTSSRAVLRRATIGGAIMSKKPTSSFVGTLLALETYVEIAFIKKTRVHSKWLPLSHLLNEKSQIEIPSQGIIRRVRIALNDKSYSSFSIKGSFTEEPLSTVVVAFVASLYKGQITDPSISFTFPFKGVVYSSEINRFLSTVPLPSSEENTLSVSSALFSYIEATVGEISNLQKIRVTGTVREILTDLSNSLLSENS